MRKKQPHGGLSPHHVRLIRHYLHKVDDNDPQRSYAALSVWIGLLTACDGIALERAKAIGLAQDTVAALKEGIAVLRRKRIGRLGGWCPSQSFAALEIAAGT